MGRSQTGLQLRFLTPGFFSHAAGTRSTTLCGSPSRCCSPSSWRRRSGGSACTGEGAGACSRTRACYEHGMPRNLECPSLACMCAVCFQKQPVQQTINDTILCGAQTSMFLVTLPIPTDTPSGLG